MIPRDVQVLGWLRRYDRSALRADTIAGLTVAALLVPQAMAYALLAGLPPQAGLYAAAIPVLVYAVLGSSRELSVGPVAIVSLLTATELARVTASGDVDYAEAAAGLAILVAGVHILMGVARIGFAVNFISHPVLVGFTAAAAILIALSQVRHLIGVEIDGGGTAAETVAELWGARGEATWLPLVVGGSALAFVGAMRIRARTSPAALLAAVAGILAVLAFDLRERGLATVGEVPRGLPAPGVPDLGAGLFVDLLPAAVLITVIGYLEAIAVGRAYARRRGYRLRPNQELVAMGAANAAAGAFGGYPVSGSFSRTAQNATAGARTQMSSVVVGVTMLAVLVVLAPALEPLPTAVLAALIIVAVAGLIDVGEMRRLGRVKPSDLAVALLAFGATLALGVEIGLLVAVLASFVVVAGRSLLPRTRELGRVPGTDYFRDRRVFPEVTIDPRVAILRFDADLTFLNARWLRRALAGVVRARERMPRAVVIDLSGVNAIDSSAEDQLAELVADYAASGAPVHLAGAKAPVREVLQRSGLWAALGARAHPALADAVRAAAAEPERPPAREKRAP